MRAAPPRYPVDRYLVQSNINNELDNIINEDLWKSEPALRPEDEKTLRKLHEMLRSTADDLKVISDELAKQHENGIRVKPMPTPLDEEFNEKVHIKEVVRAKFYGNQVADAKTSERPVSNIQKDVVDGLIKTIAEKHKVNVTTKGVQANEAPVKKINTKNLVRSHTRVLQVNHETENVKNNKGNHLNNVSRIGYSEYSYKYVEPKPLLHIKGNLQIQKLPKVNIRSELKIQNVLQLDILPDDAKKSNLQNLTNNNSNVFIVKHQSQLVKSDRLDALQALSPVASQLNPVRKSLDRKYSKIQTCESSESTEHVTYNSGRISKSQKQFKRVRNTSPASLITSKRQEKSKNFRNTTSVSLDEWKNKLNAVYGPSTSKARKSMQSKTKNQSANQKTNTDSKVNNKMGLNNVEYIPYSKLTLGGVSLNEIEKEISDLPDKKEIPLGPILEKILSSRENTMSANTPRINRQKKENILTTSDENLLKEVLDIQEKISKSLQEEDQKSIISNDENDTYADDFDDDKTDSSYKLSHQNEPHKLSQNESNSKESKTNNSPITDEEKIEFKIQNETFTKSNSLSFKKSVDVFEYVHEIKTQDSGTQSNMNKKMSRKQTQTSPRSDKNNIQSIHNDLKSTDPLEDVEHMFKLEKDFIKKLIVDEYGDIFTNSISKPSTSRYISGKVNDYSSQKDTQTSPARMKSVMTSPTRTKTRTTSPFELATKVDRHTSPIPVTRNEDHQNDCDDISINLSSPRFSLRLPQTSRDVMSNLDAKPQRTQRALVQSRQNLTTSSSSSVDEYSSSDISSWGEIERYKKYKKMYRKLKLSTTEESSSPTPRRSVLSEMPLRSEGEISFGQIRRKVRKSNKDNKSEGEASLGELLTRARK